MHVYICLHVCAHTYTNVIYVSYANMGEKLMVFILVTLKPD